MFAFSAQSTIIYHSRWGVKTEKDTFLLSFKENYEWGIDEYISNDSDC